MSQPAGDTAAPPETIYIIRHAEKPNDPSTKPHGVDFEGVHSKHSLLPRGWQRSGALTALFDPALGPPQAELLTPATLLCPSYGGPDKTVEHRAYQTIQPLAERLGLPIASPFIVGHEAQLAASLVSDYSGVVLICWEHDNIPALADGLPTAPGTAIPPQWPGDRFDVIWAFTRAPGPGPARYAFSQIPQRLLPGDADTVIT
jgi:broad specificity phosphatase PhoE